MNVYKNNYKMITSLDHVQSVSFLKKGAKIMYEMDLSVRLDLGHVI